MKDYRLDLTKIKINVQYQINPNSTDDYERSDRKQFVNKGKARKSDGVKLLSM